MHPPVLLTQPPQETERSVPGAVIDKDKLSQQLITALQRLGHRT